MNKISKNKDKFLKILKKHDYLKIFDKNKINNLIISSIFNQKELKEINLKDIQENITDAENDKSIDVIGFIKEVNDKKTVFLYNIQQIKN